jgi:hypothetical protein
MSKEKNYQNENNQPLDSLIISNYDLRINNHWSPCIEKELLKEAQSFSNPSVKISKTNFTLQNKAIYILIGLLALLSFGICIQANSIAQALREVARISALQIYSSPK